MGNGSPLPPRWPRDPENLWPEEWATPPPPLSTSPLSNAPSAAEATGLGKCPTPPARDSRRRPAHFHARVENLAARPGPAASAGAPKTLGPRRPPASTSPTH